MTTPIVFVSYAYDSPEHRGWVLRLAEDLRRRGIDLILDTWHLRAGADIGHFMIESVGRADRVLVVCSSKYVERASTRVGGAGYESALVTAELVRDQGTTKFVPVMRANPTREVPAFLGMRRYVDFTDDARYDASLAELLLELHEAADTVIPPIGPNPFRAQPPAIDASGTHGTPRAAGGTGVDRRGPAEAGSRPAESSPDAPPIGVDDAEARLKDLMQDPHRRIAMHDVLHTAAAEARRELETHGILDASSAPTAERLRDGVERADAATRAISRLLALGAAWATPEQIPAFASALRELLPDHEVRSGVIYPAAEHLARYPILRALCTAGLAAVHAGTLANLHALLWIPVSGGRRWETDRPLVAAVHEGAAFSQPLWKELPGYEQHYTPISSRLEALLAVEEASRWRSRDALARIFDRMQALVALAYADAVTDGVDQPRRRFWMPTGTHTWRRPEVFREMQGELAKDRGGWAPLQAGFFARSEVRASALLDAAVSFTDAVLKQTGWH